IAGGLLLAAGLLLYMVGRALGLPLFSVASHIPVIAGAVLMVAGVPALRAIAFPLLFLLFLVPLPGFVMEAIATPLKELVSAAVQVLLSALGYPIERSGVVLALGNQQLLVADACSGMNSLYGLAALTLVYLHLTAPSTRTRIVALLAAVVPIAIIANVLRVAFLVLLAYHGGDEMASGPLHTVAGMMVFVVALFLLIQLDRFFSRASSLAPRASSPASSLPPPASLSGRAAIAAVLLMSVAALAAPALKPVHAEGAAPNLESLVPASFGDWSIDPTVVPVAPSAEVQAKLDRIYGATLSRTYVSSAGERMMLVVAYGGDQSDALKAHRQEVCYTAQGFSVSGIEQGRLQAAGRNISVTRMQAVLGDRSEPVTYWFTMGDRVVRGRLERLGMELASGMRGVVPDGMLVRVSSLSSDPPAAYAAQQRFIGELLGAVPAETATRLAGAPRG
ncbi:MAG TPA: EpsI family protein, partial [Usitatibacter sp.]|nr:EpsI family protein [Usitatibacter sp.]